MHSGSCHRHHHQTQTDADLGMREAASNSLGRKDSQNLDQVPPKRTGLGPVVKAQAEKRSPAQLLCTEKSPGKQAYPPKLKIMSLQISVGEQAWGRLQEIRQHSDILRKKPVLHWPQGLRTEEGAGGVFKD